MNAEQKALKACADYARLLDEIKRLTREIGDRLSGCLGVDGRLKLPDWASAGEAMEYRKEDETHLKQAYRGEVVDGVWEPYLRHYSASELVGQLSVCPHCLAAHNAIQERKQARKSLGAAKRAITMIGRRAMAAEAQ